MKQQKQFPMSKAQKRLLDLLNIDYDPATSYAAIAELLISKGLPKNGIPFNVNPSTAKSWPDEYLLQMIAKEVHMREEHGLIWCSVYKEYHESKKE